MRAVGRVVALLASGLIGLPALAGCAQPSYQFVGNDDHDLVLKVPASWGKITNAAAQKASGQAATATTGWRTYYDGAPHPQAAHATATTTADPLLMAVSVDVAAENRTAVTDDVLRDLVLPVTEAGRAQEQMTAAASGQKLPRFKLLRDRTLSTKTEQGVHVLFSYTTGVHTEVYDQVAVSDPKHTRIHLALVHCAQACFNARGSEIDQVVSSLTVKKT